MDEPADPSFDDLVAECAERLDREGAAALDALCARHPRHAAALRRAMKLLLDFGVVGPTADPEPAAPRRLGEFDLIREIGRGGMGVVYEARQPSLGRTVALKVLPTPWVQDPRQVSRFQNEARAAATLDHPHIVPVFVFGEDQGTHYYAMPMITGISIRRLVAALRGESPAGDATASVLATLAPARTRPGRGRSSDATTTSGADWARRVAELARQTATALDKAHAVGILHRDIKPGNLMVDASGHVWITDFGLAHFVRERSDLTRSGEFVGTLTYSSPEQIDGRVGVDARADVYSLGATLYEMVSLRPPFSAADSAALVHQILTEEPRPLRAIDPHIPRDLATIVQKAMAKEPAARYQRAAALAADLQAFVEGRPIAARPITTFHRVLRWGRRNPVLAAALAGVAALALVALGVGWAGIQVARERDRALRAESRLTQLSAERRIQTIRQEVEVVRRGRMQGGRFASLRLLREAVGEVDAAAATPAWRSALLCQLRTDAFAALDLWDATAEPLAGKEQPQPLAFDPTFALCADARDNELVVSERGGRELARLGDLGRTPHAEFNPAGDWLYVGSETAARLWEWRTGRVLKDTAWFSAEHGCWTADGREFVTLLHKPMRLSACDLRTGSWRDLTSFDGPETARGTWSLSLAPGGQQIAACFIGLAEVWLLDLVPDRKPRRIPLPLRPLCAAWEPDGRHLLVGGELGLLQLEVASGTVAAARQARGTHTLVCSTSGDLAASRGLDQQVLLWDSWGARLLAIENRTDTRALAFLPDGQRLGWEASHDDDGKPAGAHGWRLHRPVVLRELPLGHEQSTSAGIAFHPTAPLLAVLAEEAIVFLDSGTGTVLGTLPWPWASEVAFLPDGWLCVAVRGRNNGCFLVPVDARQLPQVRVGKARRLQSVPRLQSFDAQGDVIGSWDGHSVRIVSREDRELVKFDPATRDRVTVSIAPGGKYAVLNTFTGNSATVWNTATRQKELEIPGWERSVAAKFSPDGRLLLALRRDEAWVFETGSWRRLAVIARGRIENNEGTAAFSPDSRLLAVACTRSRIQLLSTDRFQPLLEFDAPDDEDVGEPSFSPDGMQLASASHQRPRVCIWDLRAARVALRELGLDWSAAPIPDAPARPVPLRLEIEK